MDAIFQKTAFNALVPFDEDASDFLKKMKIGRPVRLKITSVRNHAFHRKYWALINLAYDFWEPEDDQPMKNKDRFRKDITILAGFYEQSVRLNGDIRTEAKSISFANMDDDEFEKLFSKTIDVILKHVCKHLTDEEIRNQVADMVVGFV